MKTLIKLFFKEGVDSFKVLFTKKWYTQIPNLLTLSRGIAPFIVIPLVISSNLIGSVITLGCFAFTDFLDGFIARKYNLYSEFGKKLDTVCDKIFSITLLLPTLLINPLSSLCILLEGVIAFTNTKSQLKGNKPKSNIYGKTKTWILSIYILLNYLTLFINIPSSLSNVFLSITLVSLGISAINYKIEDSIKDKEKVINNTIVKQEINNKESDSYTYQDTINYNKEYTDKPKVLVKKYNNKRINK